MRPSSTKLFFLLPAIAACALVGCAAANPSAPSGSATESESPSSSATTSAAPLAPDSLPEGMGSGAPDGKFPRTVAHFGGETVIDQQPQRVIVLGTGQMDVLTTFGVVPVGATPGSGADLIPEYLAEANPEQAAAFAAMQSVGQRTEPSKEAMLELKPDLILMNSRQAEETTLADDAKSIAPTVVTEGTGVNWKQDMLLVADAIGMTDKAQQWLDDYETRTTKLGETADQSTQVSVARQNDDRIRVYGLGSFSGSILTDAGFNRPKSQQVEDISTDISAEQLGQADGDWLFYGVQGDEDTLAALPLWPRLKVVAAERAVRVEDDPWFLNAGPTAASLVLDDLEEALLQ